MKISYTSDIHIEFGDLVLHNEDNSDVLIFAGDIIPYKNLYVTEQLLETCSKEWKDVIIVLGNHDHYRGNFLKSANKYKEFVSQFINVHVLDKQYLEIGDTRFVGATLWTSYFRSNPMIMEKARTGMNDHKYITHAGYRKFTPKDALNEFYSSYDFIRNNINHDKVVLITHHAPSLQSIPEEYKSDDLSGAYASDLDNLFWDYPQIKIAIHGHIHTKLDYKINQTRILCNPRGYVNMEKIANNFKLETVEV
jgi:Icc-related predicted phosphoesterase